MTEFDALYERYAPIVLRYALFLCGDRALAEDVTSETFVRVWAAAGPIRHDTVRAYLFTIARNLCRDSWRRSRRHGALDEGVPDKRASVEKQAEDRSELGLVWSAMAELPEADRALLLMRALHELSYRDISRALGVSVAAAKVRVHRARLRLLNATRDSGREPEEKP